MTAPDPRETTLPTPRRSQFWAPFAIALCLLWNAPAFANDGVRIVLPRGPLAATDQFQWFFQIRVVNDLDRGIYIDSLLCTWTDLDPGTTRGDRSRSVYLPQITRLMGSLSARDSATARYEGLALAEHARLSFVLKAHDADGRPLAAQAELETRPGSTSRLHPSKFLVEKKHKVEVVYIPEVWPAGLSPGVLLVHGEGSHARRLLPLAWELSNRGYATMMVSLPGYGESSGEPDFAGPASLKVLDRALQHLRRTPGVDSSRIAVWGISQGATAAALLGERRKDLQGLVLQSGFYDLAAAFETTTSDSLRAQIQRDAGKKGEGWKRRSPAARAANLVAPVLLIHGGHDQVVPPAQASDLAAALRGAGRSVTLELLPDGGHWLVGPGVTQPALAFLREHLHPSK